MSNDVVMYSYKKSDHEHINEHEKKRLRHSISSLRENNLNVIGKFIGDGSSFPKNSSMFFTNSFTSSFSVIIKKIHNE